MDWIACELHTHTIHSDASHTLHELSQNAVNLGFQAIALTDHNTTSGHLESEAVRQKFGLHILPGIEWTTFYGHMLVLGTLEYVDWRDVDKTEIHDGLLKIHHNGGFAGLAHPFRVGSPMCTGCFWEYEITDWNDIDFIEVWSGLLPSVKLDNRQAFQLWTDCLNNGYRVSATSGRDWHHSDPMDEPVCATYIGVAPDDGVASLSESVIRGLRQGAISVSMGPRIDLRVSAGDRRWGIGSCVPESAVGELAEGQVNLDFTARAGYWTPPEQEFTVALDSNEGCLAELKLSEIEHWGNVQFETAGVRWLRAELYGVIHGLRTMIGFTNPIYVQLSDN